MSKVIEATTDVAAQKTDQQLKRVLWVDDDPHLAAGFARRLRRKGIQIIHAFDGMQGYWMAASQKPDVVITDLKMPKWPGKDLVECLSLNRQLSGIPTIVVSGHVTPADRKQLLKLGVAAVLDKPIALEDLLIELDKLD